MLIGAEAGGRGSLRVYGRAKWAQTDRIGGPLDHIFDSLRASFSGLRIERLTVTNESNDELLWFISLPGKPVELQIECRPAGESPFLVESDDESKETNEISVAVETLTAWLR